MGIGKSNSKKGCMTCNLLTNNLWIKHMCSNMHVFLIINKTSTTTNWIVSWTYSWFLQELFVPSYTLTMFVNTPHHLNDDDLHNFISKKRRILGLRFKKMQFDYVYTSPPSIKTSFLLQLCKPLCSSTWFICKHWITQ